MIESVRLMPLGQAATQLNYVWQRQTRFRRQDFKALIVVAVPRVEEAEHGLIDRGWPEVILVAAIKAAHPVAGAAGDTVVDSARELDPVPGHRLHDGELRG